MFFVAAHINHIRDIAGVDTVGLGAGYDGINQWVLIYSFCPTCNSSFYYDRGNCVQLHYN